MFLAGRVFFNHSHLVNGQKFQQPRVLRVTMFHLHEGALFALTRIERTGIRAPPIDGRAWHIQSALIPLETEGHFLPSRSQHPFRSIVYG